MNQPTRIEFLTQVLGQKEIFLEIMYNLAEHKYLVYAAAGQGKLLLIDSTYASYRAPNSS